MDVTVDSPVRARARTQGAHVPRSWSGLESGFVLAALAAAPWPLYMALTGIGVASGKSAALLHGSLSLAAVLVLMVAWTHRPEGRALFRFGATVLGAGLLGELLSHALTDGTSLGLAGLDNAPRALVVWVIAAGLYELAPIAAASARVVRDEPRALVPDLAAHAFFAALGGLAYALPPETFADEPRWLLSPWMAAAIALPLAAARCGPAREATLPLAAARTTPMVGLAVVTWALAIGLAVADREALAVALRALEDGATAGRGVRLALPALSLTLSLGAALALALRALEVRHAPHGAVASPEEDGFTLTRPGKVEPTWVSLAGGTRLADGATVTVLGVRPRPADTGPFRDGAAQWVARAVWAGTPRGLARALATRAAAWLAWAGVSAIGVLVAMW